jgi:mannose-6-phosphate isomerase-like protein (cupin superfamily)
MSRDRALVLRPGEGRQLSLGSMQLSFKADGAESEGRYALSVATASADSPGTSPHIHREHDDIFFVIDGTLAFTVADETFEAAAGTLVVIPRGLAHRWWNPRSESTTFLNVHVPASGFESFVSELAQLSAEGRASPETMTELGARYDVYFDEDVLRSRYSS